MTTAADDPGRQMARLEPGDWWQYAVEGSVARDGRTMALRGEVRVTIARRDAGGRLRSAIVFTPNHLIVGVAGAAGDNMGPGGSDRFAKEPQVFYPGAFDADTAYDNVLDFGPHGRVANTLRTVGIETVETALGRFAAWKAPIGSTSEHFGSVEGCDWWRPALGAPLRFEMVANGPDGSRLETKAVLRATSRALA